MDEIERLRQMYRDILLLLGIIADGEKRLEKMKLEAQQLNCKVKDRIEDAE